ncbi:MAG: hypothetical protein ACT4PL_11390 [Phycisphaerales bacterium]
MVRAIAAVLLMVLAAGGCASRGGSALEVAPGDYAAAFEAARAVLRENSFAIERQDARAGVISTRPRSAGGIATPWDGQQSTTRAEIEDTMHRQARAVTVRFRRAGSGGRAGLDPDDDLLETPSPVVLTVTVDLLRRQRPGWRVEPTAINLSSYSSDPALAAAGLEPTYDTVIDQDDLLAGRILRRIEELMADRGGPAE